VNKNYQKKMPVAPDAHGLAVPEHITVAMAEIVGDMREGSRRRPRASRARPQRSSRRTELNWPATLTALTVSMR